MSKAELVFTRRFSMGHRLIDGASESCALPHGHNEFVTVALRPVRERALDGRGNMIVSFREAKQRWHEFVDTALDHALQLSERDPLLEWFRANEPGRAARIVVTPGDPTTELMAALMLAKLNAFLREAGETLVCEEISLQETPTNTVRLTGDAMDYLPPAGRAAQACWWHRPDFSIQ
ncbi:6-pyruvoyl trahydropterin synthase family protein [Acidomonas methanolica]|uniref:6-carboxy-5,6,7,8-tetrahydropterin synthase n=1 Tax=Acidomonas methanolica NBRC 104435 TaxID=1231351 RepID=A0A023D1E4_ACIMT|nr:6-carboxytetrahydropterin synthase [Acidomonas methanolica]MBU2652843.1 6-carboxytetrahydropterin synthase [Acidomonas methanolica]TCS31247.1 6-pyruvoyltetrahydropterin/6-carboxytetrahydropterin synthase [Acidomonas methanolica]GAJ27957.1 hypothetical protein Amme_011_057 [Acidomonas methanolica NBRC 104435]GBQ48446.1 hypothetical protein AA0498_0761 [Acidomonas methanolica]GEK98506.1 hypothetical protein AME01nite_10050 [Acidomonas methanolica NBRC 104435]